jgi:hypothetical protein
VHRRFFFRRHVGTTVVLLVSVSCHAATPVHPFRLSEL